MSLRPALVLLHRWFGLAGAVWLFILGFTGALLVFYSELDHALNPGLFRPSAAVNAIGFSDAARAVETHDPGRRVTSIYRGALPGESWLVFVEPVHDDERLEIYVDPATGAVRGARDWNAPGLDSRHLMPFLYRVHYDLHLGSAFEWIIGLVGFLWVLDHIVSASLSFPVARRWRESFMIRRKTAGHKRAFDLHRAIGLWVLPITLIVAATGTYMNWRPYAAALVSVFSQQSPWPGESVATLPTPLLNPPLSFDDAVRAADHPHVQGVSYDASRGVYAVNAFSESDVTDDYGAYALVIDARSGAIIDQRHVQQGTAADVIDAWALPLHSGKALGWPGRIAVCVAGLALCSFVVTGLMLWAGKRRGRVARRARVA